MIWIRRKWRAANVVALVALAALFVAPAALAAKIEFRSEPGMELIGPDNTLARYAIAVTDEAGAPVRDVRLKYSLHSPPKNALFSTDFPIVEGTTLMEADVVVPDGVMSYEYLTPIRGEYRLEVEASSAAETSAFAPIRKEFNYHIAENPVEVRNGSILIGLLFVIGLVSGFVIARPRAPRLTMAGLLVAIVLLGVARDASAHGEKHAERREGPIGGTSASDSVSLTVDFEPDGGRVGDLVAIRGVVRDAAGKLLPNALITIHLHHIEDDKTMYEGTFSAPGGLFEWKNQFFDGAEHNVIVTVAPLVAGAFDPVTFESVIDVEAIDPPVTIIMRTLCFMVGVTAIGMVLGAACSRLARLSPVS